MGTSGEQLRRTRPSLASLGRMVKRPRRDSGGTMPATVDSWRMRMAEPWTIKGEYLENCNCEVLCPCLLGPRNARGGAMARPTEGTCDVPVVFAVARGRFGTVALGGTHAALVVHTPGPMGEGIWTAGVYVDERATADQRRAVEASFAGRAGGVMASIAALVTTWLPARTVAIHFAKQGRNRSARIPDVLDVEIEGIEGRDGSEVWIDKVRHFVSSRLAAARATRSTSRALSSLRGLGSQEETAFGHDLVAWREPLEHLDELCRPSSELYSTLDELALVAVRRHVDDRAVADRLHSRAGHDGHVLRRVRLKSHGDEHSKPQVATPIGYLDADLGRSRARIDSRVDVRDAALHLAVGCRRHCDRGLGSDANAREIPLVEIADDPHRPEVGDDEELLAAIDDLPGVHAARDDEAVGG